MGSVTTLAPTSGAKTSTAGVVVILSRLQMLSQAVAAALRARGLEADEMAWALGVRRATHDLTSSDVVLLLDDLEDLDFGLATHYLMTQSPARFVVLTSRPEGPVWGALLATGVAVVMPTQSSLDEVAKALALVGRGESPMAKARRADLVREWVDWLAGDTDPEPTAASTTSVDAGAAVRPISPRRPSASEQ